MRPIFPYLFFIFTGFLSGSVLYSWLLPRWLKGIDIVQLSDDGNPGTANAVKLAGLPVGLLCLACDLGKGFLPIWYGCQRLNLNNLWFAPVLAAPVLGHAFSPMFHGKGGKAVAVSFGVLLGLLPHSPAVWLLAVLYIFFSVAVAVRPHRLRTLLVYGLFAGLSLLLPGTAAMALGYFILAAAVACRHLTPKESETPELVVLGRHIKSR